MADYFYVKNHIKKAEGGWANSPSDKGGCTMSGITIGTFREYYGKDKTCGDLKNLTEQQWDYIFTKGWWNPLKLDQVKNGSIAILIADMAFMSGTKTAIKKIQGCLGASVDGIIGPKTLALINAPDTKATFYKLWGMRYEWLCRIAYGNNLAGWLNRLRSTKYVE